MVSRNLIQVSFSSSTTLRVVNNFLQKNNLEIVFMQKDEISVVLKGPLPASYLELRAQIDALNSLKIGNFSEHWLA